jgi:hypothetical membrane protein
MNMKIQRGSIYRPDKDYYKYAGILLLVAGIQFFLSVIIAETQFPGYSTARNYLSDLGGSTPIIEPSAMIFNLSLILLGVLSIIAVYLILKSGGCRLFSSCLLISSIGAIGVGLFPEYTGTIHIFFALITFLFGSLAVIFSYRLGLNIPMVIVSLIIGFTGLMSLLFFTSLAGIFGPGGTERLVVYPTLLYLIALGGYLTSRGKDWVKIRFTSGYW